MAQEQVSQKPETEDPQLTVGEFTIKKWSDKAVFIRKADGEGSQFPADVFEQAVRDFYNDHI
jgi:hypothetical protein